MLTRTGLALALVAAFASAAQAQLEPPVDSLIDHFIERGALSNWQPNALFKGCPDLEDWQERGFRRLASAELSREREDDLAHAWMFVLRDCSDPRLEQWYIDHLNAAIHRGEGEGMIPFWTALDYADSPRIREYLQGLMLDVGVPMSVRDAAGATLFVRLGPDERMREYLRGFETMRLPLEVAWGQTERLLEQDSERLLREVGRLVSVNPALGDQTAFNSIVESSNRYASDEARRALGEALQAGLDRAGGSVTGRRRTRLEAAAQWLRRPPR